jgi:hypothetical protein
MLAFQARAYAMPMSFHIAVLRTKRKYLDTACYCVVHDQIDTERDGFLALNGRGGYPQRNRQLRMTGKHENTNKTCSNSPTHVLACGVSPGVISGSARDANVSRGIESRMASVWRLEGTSRRRTPGAVGKLPVMAGHRH